MIGLRRGKEHAIDLPAEHQRQPGICAGTERLEDRRHGAFEIGDGGAAAIDRAQDVDKHDLAVEAGKVVIEEGSDDERFVALEAAHHHRRERAAGRAFFGRQRHREEG